MSKRAKVKLVILLIIALLVTGAGIWGYSYFTSVDFKVNRLINRYSRHSEGGILGVLGLLPPDQPRTVPYRETIAGLTALGPPATDSLLLALRRDKRIQAKIMAAEALARIDDPRIVPALITALRDPDVNVRGQAAGALGQIGDVRAVEPLIEWLGQGTPEAGVFAAHPLGRIGGPRATEALIELLGDSDPLRRQRAAYALDNSEDPRALELLIGALKDQNLHVRIAAADSLGEIGDPRAIPALEELLSKEKNPRVRDAASAAIQAIRHKAPPPSQPSK